MYEESGSQSCFMLFSEFDSILVIKGVSYVTWRVGGHFGEHFSE